MAVQQGPWTSGNWDPQNLSAGFKYDPNNYNPADYARFKEARAARDKQSLARERKAFDDLTAKLDREIQKIVDDAIKDVTAPTADEVRQAARNGAVLSFNGGSTCFASLEYADDGSGNDTGIVSAVFQSGHAYDAPLDLETFLEWCSGSAGEFFNYDLGQDFFAAGKAKGK